MAVFPGPPPAADSTSSANQFWSILDKRIQEIVKSMINQLGKPRSRTLTINLPIAGNAGSPVPGWLVTVGIAHNIKIVGWAINAIVPGSITIDLQTSSVQASSGTPPSYISLPGSSHYIVHSGYTSFSNDTSAWNSTQVPGGSFLHVFVLTATSIQQAILTLRVIDMDTKTLGQ